MIEKPSMQFRYWSLPNQIQAIALLACAWWLAEWCFQRVWAAPFRPLDPWNEPFNVNRNPNARSPSEYTGHLGAGADGRSATYTPSPNDWRPLPVYSITVDRFYDGDPTNNELGDDGNVPFSASGYHPWNENRRQGGDFRGVIEKLDYIRFMGFRVLLLSNVFLNDRPGWSGLQPVDMTLLDPRLGTLDELRQLVREAHAKGMYVWIQVELNHIVSKYTPVPRMSGKTCNETIDAVHASNNSASILDAGIFRPFETHAREYCLVRTRGSDSGDEDFQVRHEWNTSGLYPYVYATGTDQVFKERRDNRTGTYSSSDAHHNGPSTDLSDPWMRTLGAIRPMYPTDTQYNNADTYSLLDLRNEEPHVRDKIVAMTRSLLASTDVDGLYIDNEAMLSHAFLVEWCASIRTYARAALGKSRFALFGRGYQHTSVTATTIGVGSLPTYIRTGLTILNRLHEPMLDGVVWQPFVRSFYDSMMRVVSSLNDLTNTFIEATDTYMFSPSSQFKMLTTVEYDIGQLDDSNGRYDPARFAAAFAFLFVFPGIPMLTAGTERAGRVQSGDALFASAGAWDRTDPTLVLLRRFAHFRPLYRHLGLCDFVLGSNGVVINSPKIQTLYSSPHFDSPDYSPGVLAFRMFCGITDWSATPEMGALITQTVVILNSAPATGRFRRDYLLVSSPPGTVFSDAMMPWDRTRDIQVVPGLQGACLNLSTLPPFEVRVYMPRSALRDSFPISVVTISPAASTVLYHSQARQELLPWTLVLTFAFPPHLANETLLASPCLGLRVNGRSIGFSPDSADSAVEEDTGPGECGWNSDRTQLLWTLFDSFTWNALWPLGWVTVEYEPAAFKADYYVSPLDDPAVYPDAARSQIYGLPDPIVSAFTPLPSKASGPNWIPVADPAWVAALQHVPDWTRSGDLDAFRRVWESLRKRSFSGDALALEWMRDDAMRWVWLRHSAVGATRMRILIVPTTSARPLTDPLSDMTFSGWDDRIELQPWEFVSDNVRKPSNLIGVWDTPLVLPSMYLKSTFLLLIQYYSRGSTHYGVYRNLGNDPDSILSNLPIPSRSTHLQSACGVQSYTDAAVPASASIPGIPEHRMVVHPFCQAACPEQRADWIQIQTPGVPEAAFRDCATIGSVLLDPTVVDIQANAFRGSSVESLDSYFLPIPVKSNGMLNVGSYAMAQAQRLVRVQLVHALSIRLADRVFAQSSALERVVWNAGATLDALGEGVWFGATALNSLALPLGSALTRIPAELAAFTQSLRELNWTRSTLLPAGVYASSVRVGTRAFYASGLERLVLPQWIGEIDAEAFAANTRLTRVYRERTKRFEDRLSAIGTAAFANCTSLRFIEWIGMEPNVMASDAFQGAPSNAFFLQSFCRCSQN